MRLRCIFSLLTILIYLPLPAIAQMCPTGYPAINCDEVDEECAASCGAYNFSLLKIGGSSGEAGLCGLMDSECTLAAELSNAYASACTPSQSNPIFYLSSSCKDAYEAAQKQADKCALAASVCERNCTAAHTHLANFLACEDAILASVSGTGKK